MECQVAFHVFLYVLCFLCILGMQEEIDMLFDYSFAACDVGIDNIADHRLMRPRLMLGFQVIRQSLSTQFTIIPKENPTIIEKPGDTRLGH